MKNFLRCFAALLVFSVAMLARQVLAGSDSYNVAHQSTISINTASYQALLPNAARNYLLIVNEGSTSELVQFGSSQTGLQGIQIPAGGSYEPSKVPRDSVYVQASGGVTTQVTYVVEGTIQ